MQSLTRRIDYIEESLDVKDDLLTKIQKLEKKKKEDQLENMNEKYKEYLNQQINEKEFSFDTDIVEAISLTINYIEENQQAIAKVLGAKVSNELKEEVLLHLIKENTDSFSSEMLRNSFYYIKDNFKQSLSEPQPEFKEKKSKKWFK
jgi:hypothetical protein